MNWKKWVLLFGVAALIMTGCKGKEQESPEGGAAVEETALEKGMAAVEKGEYEEAILHFNQAIAEKQDLEQIYRGIGIARMGMEEYEEAIGAFDQALAEAGAKAGSLEYDISYYKASALVKAELLNDALDVYNCLADYKPEKKTYIGRGAVYARMGNMDMARADFDRALTEDAKNYDLYMEVFRLLAESGRKDVGQEYLKKALSIDKEPNKNNLQKGKVYYYLEQYEKARTELEKIKDNGDAETILYLARVYEALGDFSYAETLYREHLELDSSNGNIYNMIADSQMNAGDYEGALLTIQEGIEKATTGIRDLSRNEIAAYEYLLDFDTAKTKMEAYLARYPEDEEAAREYIFLKSRSK